MLKNLGPATSFCTLQYKEGVCQKMDLAQALLLTGLPRLIDDPV